MPTRVQSDWITTLFDDGTTPAVNRRDAKSGLPTEVLCSPAAGGGFSVSYDSYLLLKDGTQNHTLTLVLKIHLDPILPSGLPAALRVPVVESGAPNRTFLVRPWAAGNFAMFGRSFVGECLKWNDHFWLVPPAGYTGLDVKLGSRTVRPNVYCHLYVAILNSPAGAHRSIRVANLDVQDARTRLGVSERDLKEGAFRSDADTYGRYDVNPQKTNYQDNAGTSHPIDNFSTVAHEVGHALGLPHVGVSHRDPLCQLAIVLDANLPNPASLPALFTGGSNGQACYGHLGAADRGANVMGFGTTFDEANAAPWARRLGLHTGTQPTDWSVSLSKVPPAVV